MFQWKVQSTPSFGSVPSFDSLLWRQNHTKRPKPLRFGRIKANINRGYYNPHQTRQDPKHLPKWLLGDGLGPQYLHCAPKAGGFLWFPKRVPSLQKSSSHRSCAQNPLTCRPTKVTKFRLYYPTPGRNRTERTLGAAHFPTGGPDCETAMLCRTWRGTHLRIHRAKALSCAKWDATKLVCARG